MSKHLTYENRVQIEIQLNAGASLAEIATALGKARSTIGREIRKHRQEKDVGSVGRARNRCIHKRNCNHYGICSDQPRCQKKCSTCQWCNSHCSDFAEEHCPKLSCAPYVCNGCQDLHKCVLRKFFYRAKAADQEYRSVLVGNREGFNLTMGEIKLINDIVSPCIKQGQSVYHICVNNADKLPVCGRTVQRLINSNMLDASVLDQPRTCKLRLRKGNKRQQKIDKECRKGRTIEDFHLYCSMQPDIAFVEMDSVLGKKGGKVLLTLIFPKSDLLLAFIRDHNTSQSAIDWINFLHQGLGHDDFCRLFPVLLTDNGSEFTNPKAMEFSQDGSLRTRVFYCDPMASYQKPNVENSHTFIRRVLPKGTSFDHLCQDDISLMMSHINSYKRSALGGKSPFEVFAFHYGDDMAQKLLHLLCLEQINPRDIVLKPSLLKK